LWWNASTLDEGLDMVDMVHHAFHHYDTNMHFNGTNFVPAVAKAVSPGAHGAGPNVRRRV
jgi:hypothetical protein